MDDVTGATPADIRLLSFRLGGTLFAIDLMRIREIVTPRGISPPRVASPFMAGSLFLRNDSIPVMDLARRFDLPRYSGRGLGELIIVKLPGTLLALAVDQVLEVMGVPADRIIPPDDADGSGSDFVLGLCRSGAEQVMILDIDLLHAATPPRQGG